MSAEQCLRGLNQGRGKHYLDRSLAMGQPSRINTTPIPNPESSHFTTKGLAKSGVAGTRVDHTISFKVVGQVEVL